MARDRVISVRCSADEQKLFRRLAESRHTEGRTVSDCVRSLLIREALRLLPQDRAQPRG